MRHSGNTNPPGRQKLIKALSTLLKTKHFQAITTAEIAATAGVTEGLIYKYFKDKQDFLYQVLYEHFTAFHLEVQQRMALAETAVEKVEILIRSSLKSYTENRVFARMLLLEVRSTPAYFATDAYGVARGFARTLRGVIEDGVARGEIDRRIDPLLLTKCILGSIEHACLGEILFSRQLDVDSTTATLSHILFHGVRAQ